MGDDVQWKKAEKPQIIQNVLGHPQLRPLIDDWERREPDPRIRSVSYTHLRAHETV